jgi:hypothetical protein
MINTRSSEKPLRKTLGIFFAILGAIIIPVYIYATRSMLSKVISFISLYWILVFIFGVVISLLFSITAAAVYTLGWRFSWLKPGYTNVPRLLLAMLSASLIAYFAPVVSTPEQIYFNQHKGEFEHQVELIKQGTSIDHFGNLGIEITRKSHAIVFGYLSDDINLLSSYAYVYAEKYLDLDDVFMCYGSWKGGLGQIYTTLSTNWYLCYRTDDWF